ncbi:MAG: flagellar protein FliT [Undibacterium sp.]|uniref:flagellar protein FliT n=1 Tax=Undibacterium sp. TaxID=1914977 RepID=UPI002720D11A|nr:flagellar protein FliT [Undibacterium sp.]MDO8651599.1 flagellar protein FliT [Undibacterium sp.]
MNSIELISMYENVAEITDRMLSAAREGDWDLLTKLETDCSLRVQNLKSHESPSEMPQDLRNKKIQIIRKILADDKEIRDITEPWMVQLSNLMKNSESNRKLSQAYGTSHAG